MANQEEYQQEEERRGLLPAWLWTIIWALLGTLCALGIITMIIAPFLWLFGLFDWLPATTGVALTGAEQTRIAQTSVAQTSVAETSIAQTATAQAGDSLALTATARAGLDQASIDQTSTAEASAAQTATAQAGLDQSSAAQTAAAQTAAAQTAVAQAGTAGAESADSLTPTATPTLPPTATDTPTPTPSPTPTNTPTPTPTPTIPPPIPPEVPILTTGDTYIVQRDDWLSKLSEKFYADPTAYWPIMAATNQAHAEDPSFALIEDPDLIEIGDRLIIPSAEEALEFMADFDPATDVEELFGSGSQGQLLIDNYWLSGSELAAAETLFDTYRAENPGVELINASLRDATVRLTYRAAALNRVESGQPYDLLQVHAGQEVELYSPELFLTPVDDILAEAGALEEFPEALRSLIEIRGTIYTVPLNIHRGNMLWSNGRLLAQAGLTPPGTLEEFFAACDTLRAQGITPLGMGTADGFELAHTLELVIAGTVGADIYTGLWSGDFAWSEPGVTEALQNFSRLLDCTNEDRDSVSWAGGINRVITDQAAFNLMGDWAYGGVILQGATDNVTGSPAPGTQGLFFLVSEGFALPFDAANADNARDFAGLISRVEVQAAFSQIKGSLCARADCDYDNFPDESRAYFQSTADILETGTVVPMVTHGAGAPPAWQDQFIQIATDFAASRDVGAAQAALIAAAEAAGLPQ